MSFKDHIQGRKFILNLGSSYLTSFSRLYSLSFVGNLYVYIFLQFIWASIRLFYIILPYSYLSNPQHYPLNHCLLLFYSFIYNRACCLLCFYYSVSSIYIYILFILFYLDPVCSILFRSHLFYFYFYSVYSILFRSYLFYYI